MIMRTVTENTIAGRRGEGSGADPVQLPPARSRCGAPLPAPPASLRVGRIRHLSRLVRYDFFSNLRGAIILVGHVKV